MLFRISASWSRRRYFFDLISGAVGAILGFIVGLLGPIIFTLILNLMVYMGIVGFLFWILSLLWGVRV